MDAPMQEAGEDEYPNSSNSSSKGKGRGVGGGGGVSTGLATAAAEEAAAGTWDVEEDHLLSYFLSTEQNSNSSLSGFGVTSQQQQHAAEPMDTTTTTGARTTEVQQNGVISRGSPGGGGGSSSSARNSGGGGMRHSSRSTSALSHPGAPAAVTFEHTATQQQQHPQQRRTSTSGSSPRQQHYMPGGTAAAGGQQQQQQQQQSHLGVRFEHDREAAHMPATPAVQFYASSSNSTTGGGGSTSRQAKSMPQLPTASKPLSSQSIYQQRGHYSQSTGSMMPPPSRIDSYSSSSSSSLSSVAAALASGQGPQTVMQLHQQLQSKESISPIPNHTSPISPAAIIGMGQETMMLPPPPRFPMAGHPSQQHQQQHMQQQPPQQGTTDKTQDGGQQHQHQHMEWIRQMNSLAMMTGYSTSAMPGHGPLVPTQHQHPQQQPIPPPHGTAAQPVHPSAALQQQQQAQTQQQQQQQTNVMGHTTVSHMTLTVPPTQSAQPPHTSILPSAATASAILSHAHHPSRGGAGTSNAVESAERRARRLARNRESARQSRRRKKDHFNNLHEKVNKLHTEIEVERRRQLMDMEREMDRYKKQLISNLSLQNMESSADASRTLAECIRSTGPNNSARRGAVAFQYSALRQLLLPKYQEFLLWLIVNQERYFTAGKDERSKVSKTSGRVSSKQIGEELTIAWKNGTDPTGKGGDEDGDKRGSGSIASGSKRPAGDQSMNTTPDSSQASKDANRGNLTADTGTPTRFWPLFAYEMSLSVDQEERFLQKHKSVQEVSSLPNDRAHIAVAASMATNMRTGVLFQCHAASHRNETSLLHILSPAQAEVFLKWYANNRDRCQRILKKRDASRPVSFTPDSRDGETSLNDICKQLNEALNLGSQKLL